VAQLGARFHGMEEVIGSIPIRSTKNLRISDICIVTGNLKQEIDRFLGNPLPANATGSSALSSNTTISMTFARIDAVSTREKKTAH
jgi:hypothetical protein